MSYYTEKNGRAQFWNRDMTRLEWAKWVYHHPEQTEQLLELILQAAEYNSQFEDVVARLDQNDVTDSNQGESLQYVLNAIAQTLSNSDIDNITGVNLDGN